MITVSEEFSKKLMESTFGREYDVGFIRSWIQWMIDSKYRKYKQLDRFVAEQIEEPDPEVLKIAKRFSNIENYDRRIVEILRYVRQNTKYKSDRENFGKNEYWASAKEVLKIGIDDCDGFNSTIYVLAILSGIPSYLLYNVIGEVTGGGHYWLVYLSPKTSQLYPIDGTYYYDSRQIPHRETINTRKYKKMWYIFNHYFIWKPE